MNILKYRLKYRNLAKTGEIDIGPRIAPKVFWVCHSFSFRLNKSFLLKDKNSITNSDSLHGTRTDIFIIQYH